jgi:ABC-type branched-subunit amino acid transport system permease subunit
MAVIYRATHKGLSYSQSFSQTIVFVSLIVAIVMMVIGGSLARAFALVGALSIIRFRTVLKDTKDMAYIFAALAVPICCIWNRQGTTRA